MSSRHQNLRIHCKSFRRYQWGRAKSVLWFAVVSAIVLVVVAVLLPRMLDAMRDMDLHQPADYGRLQASTVYMSPSDRKLHWVRVFEAGDEQTDRYTVLVTNLLSGKKSAEPQHFEVQRSASSHYPTLQCLGDDSIHLILNSRMLLRLDTVSGQFVDMEPDLASRFAPQLAGGLRLVEPGDAGQLDSFIVTNSSGQRYDLYPRTGQLIPQAQNYDRFHQRPFASYRESSRRYVFAEIRESHTALAPYAQMLVSYEQKLAPDEFENLPHVSLSRADDIFVRGSPDRFEHLTSELLYNRADLRQSGVVSMQLVPPVQPRYHAEVLASNEERVLVVFNPGPVAEQGRTLQLLDRRTGEVLWSRAVEQLPQITRAGAFVQADALNAGYFYIRSDHTTPALVIDNGGSIVKDLSAV